MRFIYYTNFQFCAMQIKSGGKHIQNGEEVVDVDSEILQTFEETEAIQVNIQKIKNNTQRVNDILHRNQLKIPTG